ncbi:MAG: C39 family peptidase, partial [Clostridia bacterium]|nr:C39 family peptidase [Clostridia bacterium]
MKKRVISFILVLATIIGVIGTTSITSMAAPTCYQQADSRWGSVKYGSWTVAESGCGILSLVNAVNYQTGNFINPLNLASWAYSKNYYNGTCGQGTVRATLYSNVTAAYGGTYGFKVSNLTYGTITNSTLINHLKNGGSAIVHVPNHFMAINGYDSSTGKYLVYDSSAAAKRNTSTSGSWLTAAQLNANSLTKVDWFCLVTSTGVKNTASATSTATTTTYKAIATVASGSGTVHFGNGVTPATVTPGTVVNFQTTPASGYKISQILVGGTAWTIKNGGGDAVY